MNPYRLEPKDEMSPPRPSLTAAAMVGAAISPSGGDARDVADNPPKALKETNKELQQKMELETQEMMEALSELVPTSPFAVWADTFMKQKQTEEIMRTKWVNKLMVGSPTVMSAGCFAVLIVFIRLKNKEYEKFARSMEPGEKLSSVVWYGLVALAALWLLAMVLYCTTYYKVYTTLMREDPEIQKLASNPSENAALLALRECMFNIQTGLESSLSRSEFHTLVKTVYSEEYTDPWKGFDAMMKKHPARVIMAMAKALLPTMINSHRFS